MRFTIGLALAGWVLVSGCSLAPPEARRTAKVRFEVPVNPSASARKAKARNAAGRPAGQAVSARFSKYPQGRLRPQSRSAVGSYGTYPIPATTADYDCLLVNVIGEGIPSYDGDRPNGAYPFEFGDSQCTYKGAFSTLVSASEGGVIELDVPSGADRLIQVFALHMPGGCPVGASVEDLDNSTDEAYRVVRAVEVGRAQADIFFDTELNLSDSYDPADLKDLDVCPAFHGNSNYQPNTQPSPSPSTDPSPSPSPSSSPTYYYCSTYDTTWNDEEADLQFITSGDSYPLKSAVDYVTGEVYVAGAAVNPAPTPTSTVTPLPDSTWMVRKAEEDSNWTSWTTVMDRYQPFAGKDARPNGIVVDGYGDVYVAGSYKDNSDINGWNVRLSSDQGASWSDDDPAFQYVGGYPAEAMAIAVGLDGSIYVAGKGMDGSGSMHWLVRKKPSSGGGWSTVDDYQLPDPAPTPSSPAPSQARAIAVSPSGEIAVAGYAAFSGGATHWIVRTSMSGDSGDWTTEDDYTTGGGAPDIAQPNGAAYDWFGNLFVVGRAHLSGYDQWLVRKMEDNGGTIVGGPISNVDPFSLQSPLPSKATDIVVGDNGDLYVTGSAESAGPVTHWMIRTMDYTGTWSTSLDFLRNGTNNAYGNGLGVYPNGELLGMGAGYSSPNDLWFIKRLSCSAYSAVP